MSDNLEININEYLPLRDVVFKSIRNAILSGDLKPGKRLMEKELAEKLGVSRTPVREALRKLELEGFVEMTPRKGAMVKVVTGKEIQDVLEIRAVLEALAARIACGNMRDADKAQLMEKKRDFAEAMKENDVDLMAQTDVEFHDLIFAASQNDRLIHIVNNLREQIYRFRVTYLYDKNYLKQIGQEHDELAEAICNGDVAAAEAVATRHIKNQQKAVVDSLKS